VRKPEPDSFYNYLPEELLITIPLLFKQGELLLRG
jgi:hypothetical protein